MQLSKGHQTSRSKYYYKRVWRIASNHPEWGDLITIVKWIVLGPVSNSPCLSDRPLNIQRAHVVDTMSSNQDPQGFQSIVMLLPFLCFVDYNSVRDIINIYCWYRAWYSLSLAYCCFTVDEGLCENMLMWFSKETTLLINANLHQCQIS